MATVITRLWDGEVLQDLPQTLLQVNPDTYGSGNSSVDSLMKLGESVRLSSWTEAKTFSLTWVSTDTSGFEQQILRRFFSSKEPYTITDDEFGISELWAWVDDREPNGWVSTTFHFTSRYGDFIDEYRETIWEEEMEPGASSSFVSEYPSIYELGTYRIEVTIEGDSKRSWKPGTEINFRGTTDSEATGSGSIRYIIGTQDLQGGWTFPQNRKSIVLDSTKPILGDGYFSPDDTEFFEIIHNNEESSGYIDFMMYEIPYPFSDSGFYPWKLKVELVRTTLEA